MRIELIYLKDFFRIIMRLFRRKNEKNMSARKVEKYDGECFFRGKRSHLSKLHLYKIGKAQNMPVVASPLVDEHAHEQFAQVNE